MTEFFFWSECFLYSKADVTVVVLFQLQNKNTVLKEPETSHWRQTFQLRVALTRLHKVTSHLFFLLSASVSEEEEDEGELWALTAVFLLRTEEQ